MIVIIKRFIKVNLKSLSIYIVLCTLFNWMFVAFFPSLIDEAEKLGEAFESYPEEFLRAVGVDMNQMFMSLEGFLGVENFSIIWPLIAIILAISLASSFLAGEVDEGTIEVLLAQPVSRVKLFFSKLIAGFCLIASFTVLSIFSVIPFALLHNVDFDISVYFTISFLGLLFSLAIFTMTMMISAAASVKGKVGAVSSGIMIGMYALKILSAFKESVDSVKYLSFFHYYDSNKALIENSINASSILVFLICSIVFTVVGVIIFNRRDIAT